MGRENNNCWEHPDGKGNTKLGEKGQQGGERTKTGRLNGKIPNPQWRFNVAKAEPTMPHVANLFWEILSWAGR